MIANDHENRRTYDTETGGSLTVTSSRLGRENYMSFTLEENGFKYNFFVYVENRLIDDQTELVRYSKFQYARVPPYETRQEFYQARERIDEFLKVYKLGHGRDAWAPTYKEHNRIIRCEIDHSGEEVVSIKGEGYVNVD